MNRTTLHARIILPLLFAVSVNAEEPDKLAFDRYLLQAGKYEQATAVFTTRRERGDCPVQVCEAALAIAASKSAPERASKEAVAIVANLDERSQLSAWEANQLGVILFQSTSADPAHLALAEKAFRHAQTLYKGRGMNIEFNLAETLARLGRAEEAATVRKAFEGRMMVDRSITILADFKTPER